MGFIVFVIILVLFILVVNLHQKANRLERRINDLAAQLQRERNETPIPIPKRAPVPPVAPPIQAPPRTAPLEQRIDNLTSQLQREREGTPVTIPRQAPIPPIPPTQVPPRPVSVGKTPVPQPAAARPAPAAPSPIFAAARAWLLGGNTIVRIGVVLLFIGLAFLLRYASENFDLPVESRYLGVAGAALALLVMGWRLRWKRAAYGLLLQGTGVAVLYMTIFAAMRLHALLPPGLAFALLVLVTVASAILAILQNALALACAAAIGGFAAPILTHTGSGDHVALFSYFALLNAGILLIAWFKAWRSLNLIGFVGTFSIGMVWGLQSYTPELFASTEPFLILFFLMYVGIGILFARRRLQEVFWEFKATGESDANQRRTALGHALAKADYLDGTMAFGPPLVGFGLQCAVIGHIEFGTAFSALALGLFYLGLAYILRGKSALRLLMEVCLAMGMVFGTLAIPLGFDAQWTSASWAAEGAGLYWLGLRQSRRTARIFSLFLMVAAAVAYLGDLHANPSGNGPLLDGSPLGAAILGAALLFSRHALRCAPQEIVASGERFCGPWLATAGLGFAYLISPLCFGTEFTAISWAVAGAVTMFVGAWLADRTFLLCAFAVQVAGGVACLTSDAMGRFAGGAPFTRIGFWMPAALALAALVSAWLLHRLAEAREASAAVSHLGVTLSNLLLTWGIGWWTVATISEIDKFIRPEQRMNTLLVAMAASATLWTEWARREQWRALAFGCLLPLGVAAPILFTLFMNGALLSGYVPLAWLLFFCAHFFNMRRLEPVLSVRVLRLAHILGCWLLIGAIARVTEDFLARLSEWKNAWGWLKRALVPAIYLWWAGGEHRRTGRIWPFRDFLHEYRALAAIPVALSLMAWFWLGNLMSDGTAAPLPYLPIANPMEVGLLIVLAAAYRWGINRLPDLGSSDSTALRTAQVVGCASLLALLTMTVCRTAYHWGDIPFQPEALSSSMGVQACWSIIWTCFALTLMVGGTRRKHRGAWMAGAALVGAVVIKLFFVELGNQGSLARIVSFIVVGALLLVVGYFSPLPPKVKTSWESDKQ